MPVPASASVTGFGEKNNVSVTLVTDASATPQAVEVKEIEAGATASALGVEPKKRDFLFEGWYLDSRCETPFDRNEPITEDMTLYAAWGKIGDVDDDGAVTMTDVLMVLKSTLEIPQEGYYEKRAECNGVEGVTMADVLNILKYVLEIIQTFEGDEDIEEGIYAKTILVKPESETKEGEQYASLKEAFAYVNTNPPKSEEERIRILISPGTYREHLILKAPYITLEGDTKNAKNVLLTWYYGCGRNYYSITKPLSNSDSASVYITKEAHDFIGNFDACQINVPFRNGYLTASSAEITAPYGFLFTNCTLTREARYKGMDAPKDASCTLGRPWNALCQVIFWNCKMDKHIISGDDRYVNMSSNFSRVDCRLFEGNTMDLDGNKLDLSSILPSYMRILTEKEYEETYSPTKHLAAQYDPTTKKLKEADNWNPIKP